MNFRALQTPSTKRNILSAAIVLAIATQASAQDDRVDAGANQRMVALEEVLVTAQKREQSLEEVPMSLQAFGGDALDKASMRDLSGVINFVPGASEGVSLSVGTRQYQIRGINQGAGDSTVGYYIDDAAYFIYGVSAAPMGRTYDMARVEVLRGPQSTLYGNGSMGGTVRFVTNAPNLSDVEASVRTGYTDTDGGDPGYYVDGAVSAPLIDDKLGLRVVGSFEEIGGYHDSPETGKKDINDADVTNWRANLLWLPTDDLTLKLLYSSNEANQNGGTLIASLDPPNSFSQPEDFNDTESDLVSGTLIYDFGGFSLNSTTTYIDYQVEWSQTWPFESFGLVNWQYDIDAEAINNETRLVSQGDGPLQWLIGVFYSDTEMDQGQAFNPALVPPSVQTFESESISVFGEVSWSFLDDTLVPLIGVRYFEDDRETVISDAFVQPEAETFDSVNPRFNLSWMPSDNAHYYANIAKGFRSGNFNNPDICAFHVIAGLPCEVTVDSDELWSYELGTKQTLLDSQLSLDLALYFQDWQDASQFVSAFGLLMDYQVGDAEVYGVDVGITYAPNAVEGLLLQASANWNSAEWTELSPELAAATGVREGDRLPLVPEWTVALSADYSWAITSGWTGLFGATYSHLEPQWGQFGVSEIGDSRDLLGARVGIENERFGVYLFGQNLLGEDGAIYNEEFPPTVFTQDYPRQLGVELTYNFN